VAHLGLPLRIMLTGPLVPLSGEALLSDLAEAMGDVSTLMRNAGFTGPDDALLARNLSIKRGTAPDLASASAPAFTVQVTINSEFLLHHEAAQTRYQHTLLLWEALSFKEPPLYSLSSRLQTSPCHPWPGCMCLFFNNISSDALHRFVLVGRGWRMGSASCRAGVAHAHVSKQLAGTRSVFTARL